MLLSRSSAAAISLTTVVLLASSPLVADPVPIVNPSFEDNVLCDGCIRTSGVSGWNTSSGGGDGILNPTAGQYPGGAPDGQNVAYANLVGNHVHQILATNLAADMLYTLTVEVGRRADESFAGYRVQLRADGVVLAEDNSSLTPAAGEFVTSTVNFTSNASTPQVGTALEIWLLPLGVQPNFDHVRLDATPVDSGETWQCGPDLNNARRAFPLVELSPGRLLAAGGVGTFTAFESSAEVFDLDAGTWTQVTPMPSAHRGRAHGVLLPSGRVLIAGEDPHIGVHPHPRTAYLYDATEDSWDLTATVPSIDRFNATMTLLGDGRVLFAGGYSGHSTGPTYSTAEVYDPATGIWSPTGSMAEVRTVHTATLLTTGPHTGQVLVVGGSDRAPSNQATAGCELYDPATGLWSATGSLNESRSAHRATLLPSGKVLVTGGQVNLSSNTRASAELYDPVSGTWSLMAPMTAPRGWHTATLLLSGKVLVAGGRTGQTGTTELASAELYDPGTNTWSPTISMKTPRLVHEAALLPDGSVIVVGGLSDGEVLFSTEIFPDSGEIFSDGFESGDTTRWPTE